jgi:RNA polymerase primary sigma factor
MPSENERLYFRDIQRYVPLTEEEEQGLVNRIQRNERNALHELITSNLRFVVSVARRYLGRGLSLMDLVNEGNLGLYRAAKRFQMGKNVKFISYAVWWIRQSIQQALFEQVCTVKIPPSKIALIIKFKHALDDNRGDFESTLQLPDFKDFKEEITDIIGKISTVSLDAPIGNNQEGESVETLMDMLGKEPDQEKENERRELAEAIDQILSQMNKREETILRMYYGLGFSREFTLDEIGKDMGLTRERVRQIKTKSLRKLMRAKDFKDKLSPFVDSDYSDS